MQRLGAALVCLVFAIPFGGVGVGASWVVWRMFQDSHRAQEWVGVRAAVDSFGHGKVDYRYTFNGKEYRGNRLGVNPVGGTDDIDSWHDDMFAMFSAAQTANKPITVWVNPADPAESMVDRNLRWKLVFFAMPFALGFGGVGLGALLIMLRTLFRGVTPSGGAAQERSSRGMGLAGAWIFAFFWNVISVPAAVFIVQDAVAKGEWMWLLLLIFPLIGVLLLWGAITSTMSAIRARFTREPELPRLLVPRPVANDGFARGMIDDPRPATVGAATIDASDDGLPPAPDPATVELERLSGKKLSAEQRAELAKMDPKVRAMMVKMAGWAGKFKQDA